MSLDPFIVTCCGITAGVVAVGLLATWADEKNKRARTPQVVEALAWVKAHVAEMHAAGVRDVITRAADRMGAEEVARRLAQDGKPK